jgi:hypothetical protein
MPEIPPENSAAQVGELLAKMTQLEKRIEAVEIENNGFRAFCEKMVAPVSKPKSRFFPE